MTPNDRTSFLPRAASDSGQGLGAIPQVALITSLGLLVIAVAYSSLRLGGPLPDSVAHVAFWIGLLTATFPVAARLIGTSAGRLERMGLILLAAEALYIVKILRDPVAFTRHDELLHWRSAFDIATTGRLFGDNPLLVVSPLYPGLESNTVAVMQLGNTDVFVAGVLVLAVARAGLALGLFLLYEEASGSVWLAGVAAGLYMVNPSFLFFSASFVYESMGIALAVGLLLLTVRRQRATGRKATAYVAAAVMAAAALVVTHHITTLATIGILALLSLVSYLITRDAVVWRRAVEILAILAALTVFWLLIVAQVTIAYLGPPVLDAARQVIGLITGEDVLRPLFTTETGVVAPIWEWILALAATGIALSGVAIGVPLIWRRLRSSPLAVVFGVLALMYPLTLVVRFTNAGELAARSAPFLFLGVAFAIALVVGWALALDQVWIPVFRRRQAVLATVAILFVGGVMIGSPTWQRFPGPFLVGADSRSITAQGLAMTEWVPQHLGQDKRFAADRTTRLLLGSYAHETVVFAHGGGAAEWAVFVTDTVGPGELAVLGRGRIDYLVIDRRLSQDLPAVGYYYEKAELTRRKINDPIRADQLDNYDEVADASRLYDSGSIQVYDVHALGR